MVRRPRRILLQRSKSLLQRQKEEDALQEDLEELPCLDRDLPELVEKSSRKQVPAQVAADYRAVAPKGLRLVLD